jgi:tetratricopeptide (TPR) repeat protein
VRAELLSTLGSIHSSLGMGREAEALLTEAVSLRRRSGAPTARPWPRTWRAWPWSTTARATTATPRRLDREAYVIRRARFGAQSAEAATSLNKIAMDLRKKGDTAQSEELFREALGIFRRLRGEEDKDVAAALKGLAMVRRERGDLKEAERFAREGLAISERVLGERDPLTTEHLSDLAPSCAPRATSSRPSGVPPRARRQPRLVRRRAPQRGHPLERAGDGAAGEGRPRTRPSAATTKPCASTASSGARRTR